MGVVAVGALCLEGEPSMAVEAVEPCMPSVAVCLEGSRVSFLLVFMKGKFASEEILRVKSRSDSFWACVC